MRTTDRVAWTLALLMCLFAMSVAMGRYFQAGMTAFWPAVIFYGSALLTGACSMAGMNAVNRAVAEKREKGKRD